MGRTQTLLFALAVFLILLLAFAALAWSLGSSVVLAGDARDVQRDTESKPSLGIKAGNVHSDSNTCTRYRAVCNQDWLAFTQEMTLSPGSYEFEFSDGFRGGYQIYTIFPGIALNHIH